MKMWLKHGLLKWGLLPIIDTLRRLPATVRWLQNGCTGVAPPPVKRRILTAYLHRFKLQEFVETGTHLGDTLAYIASDNGVSCTSIELADDYYRQAAERFRSWPNVTLHHGDSGHVLPKLVRKLNQPALFWLDGHYSGGATAKGETETPISEELQAILESPIKGHVILIDDARCFDGAQGYPPLGQLLEKVRMSSEYRIEVSADIIRLTHGSGDS